MPQSTDLVTDLPADFEVFGQAVATSMADLLGGTTGQVLSKTTNADMDFTWVTTDDTNAIQNAIVDAKGDLIAATAADTPARLPVGANNTILSADSAEATGLKWITNAPTFNGAFVTKNATQTISTLTTYIALSFQAETYDTNSYHDNTTNNSRLTVPSAGKYRFNFATISSNTNFYRFAFFKNGTQANQGYAFSTAAGGVAFATQTIDLSLAASDYVEIMAYVAASSDFYGTNSFTVPTFFSVQYLGA